MTNQNTTTPTFHVAGRGRTLLAGAALIALWAALAGGFLAQVWQAPTAAEAEALACRTTAAVTSQGHC